MSKTKEVVRPLCLKLEDVKKEIFNAINNASKNHQIPFYLLESIMNEAHQQVTELARKEREVALQTYNQQLLEAKEQ